MPVTCLMSPVVTNGALEKQGSNRKTTDEKLDSAVSLCDGKDSYHMEHFIGDTLHPRQYEKAPLLNDLPLNDPAGNMRGLRHFPHEV